MDDTQKAPKRIWAHYAVESDDAVWSECNVYDGFEEFTHYGEYVRADLYTTQQATIDALTAKVEGVLVVAEACLHEHDHSHYEYDQENTWGMGEFFTDEMRDTIKSARAALGGITNG
tara:strand:+ start:803 stop:1153 length:351 start_codon:yes stop_codon:yes gene_type:complete